MGLDLIREGDPAIRHELRGYKFYFNSYTLRGKCTSVLAAVGLVCGIAKGIALSKKK